MPPQKGSEPAFGFVLVPVVAKPRQAAARYSRLVWIQFPGMEVDDNSSPLPLVHQPYPPIGEPEGEVSEISPSPERDNHPEEAQ